MYLTNGMFYESVRNLIVNELHVPSLQSLDAKELIPGFSRARSSPDTPSKLKHKLRFFSNQVGGGVVCLHPPFGALYFDLSFDISFGPLCKVVSFLRAIREDGFGLQMQGPVTAAFQAVCIRNQLKEQLIETAQ